MIKRRKFLGTALAGSMAGLVPTTSFGNVQQQNPPQLLPPRLKKGDTIGLIAPGYTFPESALDTAVESLTSMGLKAHYTARINERHGYFSNTDQARAEDINEMFANPEIAGILCVRGGYGCTRILDLLNYDMIQANPKVLIGFSDVTALLNAIYKRTGLVGFHGPVGSSLDNLYNKQRLEDLVMFPKNSYPIPNFDLLDTQDKQNPVYKRYTLSPGTAQGIAVGGSLTLVNALVGTPDEIDFTGKIVCLEDIDEDPYRIDRMLTQLISGGSFTKAAGIALGIFKGCDSPKRRTSFSLAEVLADRIKPLGIPAAYGLSFGHVDHNFTFPIGIQSRLDANSQQLTVLGPAVS